MEIKKSFCQSALIAIIVSLLVPALWLASTGTTSRTHEIEEGYLETMSESDRAVWLHKNTYEVGFIERIKGLPNLISNVWVGYLQASLVIFIIIFTLNVAFLLGNNKNPNK